MCLVHIQRCLDKRWQQHPKSVSCRSSVFLDCTCNLINLMQWNLVKSVEILGHHEVSFEPCHHMASRSCHTPPLWRRHGTMVRTALWRPNCEAPRTRSWAMTAMRSARSNQIACTHRGMKQKYQLQQRQGRRPFHQALKILKCNSESMWKSLKVNVQTYRKVINSFYHIWSTHWQAHWQACPLAKRAAVPVSVMM
jgi:hypothetical protein